MYTVSVIIRTFNRPDVIGRALRSVVNQTLPPDQIIIVDDYSSEDYINSIPKHFFKNIKYKLHRNTLKVGPAQALNIGSEFCNSDIVMYLDDDDLWAPQKIESQLNIFNDHPEVSLVYSGRVVNDSKFNFIKFIHPKDSGFIFTKLLFDNVIGTTSSLALKTDVLSNFLLIQN